MNTKVLIIALVLTGCADGEVRHTTYDGILVVEHIDTSDAPAPCGISHLHGCHQMIAGIQHVWYSAVSPRFVARHEIKLHVRGLQHGPYSKRGPFGGDWCATITVGVEGYPLGSLICNDGRSEWVVEKEAV